MDSDPAVGRVAIPTVVLSAVTFGLVALVWWAVSAGHLSLGAGTLAMTLPAYLAFTPMHEATHGNIGGSRRWRWLDTLGGWGCAAILLVPMPLFRSGHLRHHGNVNRPEHDPDLWVARARGLGVVAACFTFIPRYYWNFLRGYAPSRTQTRDRRTIALGTMGLVAFGLTMTALGYGPQILWLWIMPAVLTGGLLSLLFAWLPHVPHDSTERWTNARIFRIPGLTLPLMAHNYHLIHHLWPRVPFHRYPAVYRARLSELRREGAHIVGSAAPRG